MFFFPCLIGVPTLALSGDLSGRQTLFLPMDTMVNWKVTRPLYSILGVLESFVVLVVCLLTNTLVHRCAFPRLSGLGLGRGTR